MFMRYNVRTYISDGAQGSDGWSSKLVIFSCHVLHQTEYKHVSNNASLKSTSATHQSWVFNTDLKITSSFYLVSTDGNHN